MEEQIKKIMSTLNVTREEAMQVIEYDKETDKMSMKELNAELTDEQKKAKKSVTKTGTRKVSATTKPKEKKVNENKAQVIQKIFEALQGYENCVVENAEKTISFTIGEKSYSVNLTEHRK